MSNWRDAHIAEQTMRADKAEESLAEAKARIAQLEDELTVSHEDTLEIAAAKKGDVNIDTGTHLSGGATLPDPRIGQGLGMVAGALIGLALLAVVWIWKRK